LSNLLAHYFLQSLIALTKERDIAELELTLKATLADLIKSVSNHEVDSIHIYRLRDISQLFLSLLSGATNNMRDEVSAELCQQLMDCYNTGEYRVYQTANADRPYHLFSLKNDIAHQNAVLAIKSHIGEPDVVDNISKLLVVYQNYIRLLNDNERDTLTGLLNRKTFDVRINKVLANMHKNDARKHDGLAQSYFLAVFDIDYFKKVNDLHGHLIGDEVLLLFSQLMAKSFRETDPLFRFGGEEFVGIFGCASDDDIPHVLHRFSKKLQDYVFPQVGKVTASVGYTKLSVEHTPAESVVRADLALYYAKNNGRNQICFYEDLLAKGLLQETKKEGDIELF